MITTARSDLTLRISRGVLHPLDDKLLLFGPYALCLDVDLSGSRSAEHNRFGDDSA